MAGNDRIQDGNGDCLKVVDIGALEAPLQRPVLTLVSVQKGLSHLKWAPPGNYELELSAVVSFSPVARVFQVTGSEQEIQVDVNLLTNSFFRLKTPCR